MWISRVRLKMWHIDVDLALKPDFNVLIGPNGGGKTTVLKTIAAITGNDEAAYFRDGLIPDQVIIHVDNGPETVVFESSNGIDLDALDDFRDKIDRRTSFALLEDSYTRRFISEAIPSNIAARKMRQLRSGSDKVDLRIDGSNIMVNTGGDAATRQSLVVSGLAPDGVPVLMENPDQHSHVVIQRRLSRVMRGYGQVICTTHSPCFISDYIDDCISV